MLIFFREYNLWLSTDPTIWFMFYSCILYYLQQYDFMIYSCNSEVDAMKTTKVHSFPQVLVVHMNR
jgi:hypothetical protein